jgi:Tol biopolymer transport system component
VFAAFAAVALLGGCGPAADGGSSRSDGEIVFSGWRGDDGKQAIYVVHLDGTVREVAADTYGTPAWSPDGEQLAFKRCEDMLCTAVVLENEKERPITPIDYGDPAWSPDGTEIAFVRCKEAGDDACAIFAIRADEREPARRVTQEGLYGQPVWSPDGDKIAFDLSTTPQGLVVVRADGSGVEWRTTEADSDPNWSPDGRHIAFARAELLAGGELRHGVYVVAADGTGARRVSNGDSAEPSWSPDGNELAYSQWVDADECHVEAIVVSGVDGSSSRRLTPYRPLQADPTWSLDGEHIAFTRTEECWSEKTPPLLWVIDADGENARPVSPLARLEDAIGVSWRPAS